MWSICLQDGTATLRDGRHADDLVRTAGLVPWVSVLTIAVVCIVWQWRTAKNAQDMGRTDGRYGAGWSIGGWFIPLANLGIPVEIMQVLWRSSDPASHLVIGGVANARCSWAAGGPH